MTDNKVVDIILHCQKQIKKERLPEEKLLHYLGRLSRLRVTVQDLAETGIGRTVNSLSRNEGPVGQAADTLVRGWKRMVSEQQNQAERESEEESDSNSNSGSSEEEEEEEEVNNVEPESYEIDDQVESRSQERRYSNGHSSYEDLRGPAEVPPPHQNRSYDDDAADDDDLNDDIEDPYMENGFLNMTNVHSDGEDDEEDEIDDRGSVGSERLEIDADEDDERSHRREEKPPSFVVKQERLPIDEREVKSLHSSKSSSLKSHESDHKKHSSNSSSSKSHRNHERSSDRSQSKERKHNHHHSSSKESSSKDRSSSKQSSSSNVEQHSSSLLSSQSHQKSYHSSSSSKPEKLREPKSEHEKSHQHREKDKHHRSKESSSSHRDKEKEIKIEKEKERSTRDKKDSNNDHRSSNSSSSSHKDKTKIRDHASSSSHSPKKSSLESSIKKESSSSSLQEDRKRKEYTSNSPSDSSSQKKSKLVLKEEIDSNSGINFADVLGSLDTSSGSSSSKHGSLKKDKKKEEHDRGHRKHDSSHHHHHSSSSSSKRHDSPSSSSKHSSSRDAGPSSSSSKKYDRDSEVVKLSKKSLPQSKIESVIQPVVNISPNYKPMSSSLAKLARPSAASISSSSSSGNGNGVVAAPPVPLSQADLSDLGTVDFWDNAGKGETSQMSQEDAISVMLSNRNARSKVYSGVKSGRRAEVSSLFDLCMQVIKDNIGDLGYTGGIPYDILKPALERANPQQLISIESQNDYLIGETDELWQFHCKRDFRGKFPIEESWRELYERCTEERQQKFEVVKKKMKRTIDQAEPVRKAKLAYVDTTSTTRFNRQKAATIKNGMKTLKIKEEKGPSRGVSSSASAGFNNPKKSGDSNTVVLQEAAVIIAPESRAGHAPAPSVSRETSAAKLKPKKAPLMQKTMKLVKSLQRR